MTIPYFVLHASQTGDIVEMERLIEWMSNNIPEGDETTVIHEDYRIGNVLIHPTVPAKHGSWWSACASERCCPEAHHNDSAAR